MREEELRSRLQALAVAGRGTPEPAAFGAVRRRARRKLQGAAALVVGLVVAVAGVWLAADAVRRPGATPVVPVAPPPGPPAAVAPNTFVAQVGDGATRRTVIVDATTGRVVRQVPGSERRSDVPADAVVGPDLRTVYLPAAAPGPGSTCDAGWTQVDLATGARRPAFAGLTGVGEFSLSADGRILAYVHISGPATLDQAHFQMRCHTELVVRELVSGHQRVWAVPTGGSVQGVQLSPDATRLAYLLDRGDGGDSRLHLLPLAGTTSAADGHDLPVAGDCSLTMWRFVDDRQLLALGARGCATGRYDTLLARFDLEARKVLKTTLLGLPVEPFGLDVDRSGRHVLITAAGKPNDQRPATAYVLRDDRLRRVPFDGDCWQADW
jgi:hypothetical protein